MSSNPQQPTQNRYDDDEIDLFELFQTIWDSKFLIIACIVFGLIASGIYAFTAKEQWTSEAYITGPKLEDNQQYLSQVRSFEYIKSGEPVDQQELTTDIFDNFIGDLTSLDNRNDFLANSDFYKTLIADTDDKQEKDIILNKISTNNLTISKSDQKEISSYYKVSFSADTPEIAQKTLSDYLKWIGNLSQKSLIQKFNFNLDSEILKNHQKTKDIEMKLEADKKTRIGTIKKALETAKAAGIKEYPAGQANGIKENSVISNIDGSTIIELKDSKYLFLLGENYLNAELKTEENATTVYPSEYYTYGYKIDQLKPLHKDDLTITSFSYQLSPTLPITRDKPKRTLILLIGIILGGMLGVFWALVRDALRKRKASIA